MDAYKTMDAYIALDVLGLVRVHAFAGRLHRAGRAEVERALDVALRVLEELLPGLLAAEAVALAVARRPADRAVRRDRVALGEPQRALAAELGRRGSRYRRARTDRRGAGQKNAHSQRARSRRSRRADARCQGGCQRLSHPTLPEWTASGIG